jgi:molybdate transport system permease protein
MPGSDEAALRLVAVSLAVSFGALVLSEFLTRRAERRLSGS